MVGMLLFLDLMFILSSSGSGVDAVNKPEAEAAYEKYLIDLGVNARLIGDADDGGTTLQRGDDGGMLPPHTTLQRGERTGRADIVSFSRGLKNMTVPPGEAVALDCETVNAERVDIMPRTGRLEAGYSSTITHTTNSITLQLLEVLTKHQGWYVCAAVGASGERVFSEAYITVKDVCADNECADYEICERDMYAGTFNCTCNIPCRLLSKEPVCGSDCVDHHSECEMLENACVNKLSGVKIVKLGKCDKQGVAPSFVLKQPNITFQEGSDVILRIHAVGTPDPSYRWYVNGALHDDKLRSDTVLGTMTGMMQGEWTVQASNCHTNTINTTFSVFMKTVELEQPASTRASVCGMSHVTGFSGTVSTYIGLGTYVLAEVDDVLVYGTFKYCTSGKTGTCMHSLTVHRGSASLQLVAFNTISNKGESVIVISSQDMGGITVAPGLVGYDIIAGDVTIKWDGALGYDVLLDCSVKTEGILGSTKCDNSTVDGPSGKRWLIDDYTGRSTAGLEVAELDVACVGADDYESSCNDIITSPFFSNCISVLSLDTDTLLQQCLHDMCRGLGTEQGACQQGTCGADQQLLSPLCSLATHLTGTCGEWGMFIPQDWRSIFKCENIMKTPPACVSTLFYTD